jgi:hypothetical protein
MSPNTDPTTQATELSDAMADAGAMMTELSRSMGEAADGFAAFTDSTRDLSASSSGNFAVADD